MVHGCDDGELKRDKVCKPLSERTEVELRIKP
jgi:hypothetical protein